LIFHTDKSSRVVKLYLWNSRDDVKNALSMLLSCQMYVFNRSTFYVECSSGEPVSWFRIYVITLLENIYMCIQNYMYYCYFSVVWVH